MVLIFALTTAMARDADEVCQGTTYDTGVCLQRQYKIKDAELNVAYQKALTRAAGYTQKDARNLKDAQRKWIVYRDAACNAAYNLWAGGSGGPGAHTSCLTKLTKERLADLNEVYHLDQN
jgi:uncharacterized protein YecT (DUF1311 family)